MFQLYRCFVLSAFQLYFEISIAIAAKIYDYINVLIKKELYHTSRHATLSSLNTKNKSYVNKIFAMLLFLAISLSYRLNYI